MSNLLGHLNLECMSKLFTIIGPDRAKNFSRFRVEKLFRRGFRVLNLWGSGFQDQVRVDP